MSTEPSDPQQPNKNTAPKNSTPYDTPISQSGNGVHCWRCGKQIHPSAHHCPFCQAAQFSGNPKSKFVAATLGILLGFTGAHRFYLGKWWGIFYLLSGVIGWAIAIVESLVFLLTPNDNWERKYSNVPPASGGMIAGVIIGSVFVIGILAAIAIPAYQDYTYRAKVTEVLFSVEPVKRATGQFMNKNRRYPATFEELGVSPDLNNPLVSTFSLGDEGVLTVTFSGFKKSIIKDETIVFKPSRIASQLKWDCSGGSLPAKYRPKNCRQGALAHQQALTSTRLVRDNLNHFQLRVPSYWSAQTDLNENASLQLANLRKEEYMIVLEHAAQDISDLTLNDYAQILNEDLVIENKHVSSPKQLNLNGYKALSYDISGEVENTKIDYMVVYVEGRESYYFFMIWTLPSKKDAVWPIYKKTLQTFKEIE